MSNPVNDNNVKPKVVKVQTIKCFANVKVTCNKLHAVSYTQYISHIYYDRIGYNTIINRIDVALVEYQF